MRRYGAPPPRSRTGAVLLNNNPQVIFPEIRETGLTLTTTVRVNMPSAVKVTVKVDTNFPMIDKEEFAAIFEEALVPIRRAYGRWSVTVEVYTQDAQRGFFKTMRDLRMEDIDGEFVVDTISSSQSETRMNVDPRHLLISFHLIKI